MAGVAKKLFVLPNINNVKTMEPYKARVEQQVAPLGIIESVKEAVEPNNATELLSVRFSPVKKAYVVKMFMQQDAHVNMEDVKEVEQILSLIMGSAEAMFPAMFRGEKNPVLVDACCSPSSRRCPMKSPRRM